MAHFSVLETTKFEIQTWVIRISSPPDDIFSQHFATLNIIFKLRETSKHKSNKIERQHRCIGKLYKIKDGLL